MPNVKEALKMTATCLVVIWLLNQTNITRPYVQKALTGY